MNLSMVLLSVSPFVESVVLFHRNHPGNAKPFESRASIHPGRNLHWMNAALTLKYRQPFDILAVMNVERERKITITRTGECHPGKWWTERECLAVRGGSGGSPAH